ncbi:TBC1 domain family member 13-like [Halichondria panicea]|uniref:TBC1 domain family member 13-like n=1 Tax=Halichondria panicea TaxID=6063 RepID=UPI00312BCB23
MALRKARLAEFRELLASERIDVTKLGQLCFEGCPDEEGIRATCWKLLLGYLPPTPGDWEKALAEQRLFYVQLMSEVLVKPHAGEDATDVVDHPLNPNPESSWNRYFKDNEIIIQIDHDTRRLYPDMSFFQLATPYPQAQFNTSALTDALKQRIDKRSLPSQQVATSRLGIKNMSSTAKKRFDPYSPLKEGDEAHWEVVERILFLYAKTNKGIAYVQGMNEIIGPIYYVFAQHPDSKWREHAEADTFFCFTTLMTEIGALFTKKLDASRAGIGGAMGNLMKLIQREDPPLHAHLTGVGMDPTYFSFRWITLMLSQEFLLPEVIRIWDSLFADEKRFNFLIYVCGAMILLIRTDLLKSDFSACMKLLQNYPPMDTHKLLLTAQTLLAKCHLVLW